MNRHSLKDLLNLIDKYLSKQVSYNQFYGDFNDFFKDESENSVSKEDFFEGINESFESFSSGSKVQLYLAKTKEGILYVKSLFPIK